MKKQIKIIIVVLVMFIANMQFAQAGLLEGDEIQTQAGKFRENAGFSSGLASEGSLGSIVATAINAFLGILAIIFIIILLMAGYKYMTAGGNEDKTKEAIDSIRRAIIGLIIIISAYAITYFVFNSMTWFGGGGGSGYQQIPGP